MKLKRKQLSITQQEYPTVLHISTPKSWRGGEQQLAYLYEELDKIGLQQIILCPKGSVMEQYCKKHQHKYFALRQGPSFNLLFAKQVKNMCKTVGADIIHTHDSRAHTFALLSTRIFRNNTPIVVSRRVDFPINSKGKYNHKMVKKILCVSDAIKNITGADIQNKSVLATVHSGIDVSRFNQTGPFQKLRSKYQIPADTLLIGNVAALAPHKDYFTFLDTAKLLVEKGINAKFLAIGQGNLEEELKAYTAKLGLSDHVIFTGFRKDIPEILPELDIFLITSETEGLGTSIIDAFACKVPVVATNAGGISELVENNITGMLAEVKKPDTIATAVLELINDPSLKSKVVSGATEKLTHFTREATAKKTLSEYMDVFS
jgi:glycosyltransferase involved in cell wall biosynthesis